MLHNSGPFGPSEVPVNMGASINMTSGNGLVLPSGLTVGKGNQAPNYNIPAYPSYGAVNQPNSFQNFPSNVFHNFPPNPPNVQSWNAPMNLQMQNDNGGNAYEKKDFGEFNHCLNGKSIPLNVPHVPTKAYHKESVLNSHLNPYQSYQSPTLRQYLEHNIDLSSKSQKYEPNRHALHQDVDFSIKNMYESRQRSEIEDLNLKLQKSDPNRHALNYNIGLSSKHQPTDVRQRSLDMTDLSVKPQKPEPIRNFPNYDLNFSKSQLSEDFRQRRFDSMAELTPTPQKVDPSRHILNYDMDQSKQPMEELRQRLLITENLSLKPQKPEPRHFMNYDLDLSNKSQSLEDSRFKRSDTIDTSLTPQNLDHRQPYLNYNLDLSNKSQSMEDSRLRSEADDMSLRLQKAEPRHSFLNYNLDLSTKSHPKDDPRQRSEMLEGLGLKQRTESRHFGNYEAEMSTKTPVMDESRRRTLENTVKMIENILIHNTPNSNKSNDLATLTKLNDSPKTVQSNISEINETDVNMETSNTPKEHDKIDSDNDTQKTFESEASSNKIEDYSNAQTIASTDSAKVDSDNNRICINDNTIESQDTNSIIERNSNPIEKIDIKVEFDSEAESEDVKPLNMLMDSTKPATDVTKDEDVVVKVEEVSHWADSEHSNPFLRDTFGVSYEITGNAMVVDADGSIAAVREILRNGSQPPNPTYYECPHCNLYFASPKRFLIHTKWHSFGLTNEKRLELQREKELRKHMKKEAKHMKQMSVSEIKDEDIVTGKAFKCNSCDKVFSARGSLKNHKQRYHPTRVRECKLCDKTVVGWVAMRSHLATHTSDSRYQCSDCPKRFKYSHSLAKHRDTHLEKTHGCTKCPKMFGSKALLNTHMKTHDRVLRGMTFHCSYCGKGFFESYNLQVHERTHRNERPFLCDICNTSFGTNSSLKRHVKVSHNSSKPYECTTCHRSFVSELIRDRHSMRSHGNPDDFKYPCKQCSCRYLNMKDLRKHVYKNHPKGRRKRKPRSDSE